MPHFPRVVRSSIFKISFAATVFVMALAFAHAPAAMAQRTHGGGARVGVPKAGVTVPRFGGGFGRAGATGFRVPFRSAPVFRRRIFVASRFVRFGPNYSLNPFWWTTCGPYWGWNFDCNTLTYYQPGFENYVTMPSYESPEYFYDGYGRGLVWLYLKDGSMYAVSDYWFVNDEVHFVIAQESGVKGAEQVIGVDELDLQKTRDVNTTRGFRFVRRDEPLRKYMQDHPNDSPPLVEVPTKN